MADEDNDVPAGVAAEAEATVPLDEFCRSVSQSDTRVELLAVFAFRERQAGRHHDTPSAYRARFDATHNSPTSA